MIDVATAGAWPQLMLKLREFIARRVPASDADDVLQEALLRIQRGIAKLRDAERFGPWVYQVTRSAVADHLRAKVRLVTTAEPERLELSNGDADADDVGRGLVRCLSAFVAQLPSPYREAITLTELEGLTQKAAAEMLGISLSGMKSRVQRGRARLREMFVGCCEVEQDARGRVMTCEPRPRADAAASACRCDDVT